MRIRDWSSNVCSSDLAEADREPGDHRDHLPGDGERRRLIAALDHTAGVALQLVATALHQLAADRQEPARDAVRVGDGVPEVGLVGRVGAGSDRDLRRHTVAAAGAHLAGDKAGGGYSSEEHTSELLSLMRLSYAVFRL